MNNLGKVVALLLVASFVDVVRSEVSWDNIGHTRLQGFDTGNPFVFGSCTPDRMGRMGRRPQSCNSA